jgi:homogentisate 1,2-dioxygenase
MKSWIHLSKGRVLRQAHVGLESLGGAKEDLLSRQGFSGRVAVLYREHEPTAWSRIEGTMRPLDLDGYRLEPTDFSNASGHPLRLFYNNDVSIGISRRREAMPFCVRNADGDEVHFVHEGTGVFDTEFGPIPYEPGDYIVLPKGVTYRVIPDTSNNYFFIVEAVAEIEFATNGSIGRHAPFDPAILFVPSPRAREEQPTQAPDREWAVRIKHGGEYSSVFYPFDPMDVIGWKGDLFPVKINIRDYRPITSHRMHLMPPAHNIFAARGFVIANFLPRPAEGERDVERVPPFHRNIDYDEVMFAHAGTVLSSPIAPASISLLPQGLHHGLPDAFSQLVRKTWKSDDYYEQKLIAVDTERPLKVVPDVRSAARATDQILKGGHKG